MRARFQEAQAGAQALGIAIQSVTVQGPNDFDPVFAMMGREQPQSLLVLADTVTVSNRQRTVDFAARYRVPAVYEARTAAMYVDKVLKGTKPADLPVELPSKFEFVINLKTAKTLGLTISPSLLQRADQVIE